MSWQATRDGVINFVCKVSPKGNICRNYMMSQYPECFKNNKGYLQMILETPQRWFRSAFTSSNLKSTDISVCPVCQDEEHQSAFLAYVFQVIILLAISVAILYGILKATAQRRPPVQ